MKNNFYKLALLFFLVGWTILALASGNAEITACRHEWKAGFSNSEVVLKRTDAESESEGNSSAMDSYLPGGLHSFILH